MHRCIRTALAAALGATVLVTAAFATAGGGVTVELTANRVLKTQDREVLSPAAEAHPGETLEYRAVYRNDSGNEARGLAATLPIPRGTTYMPGTASPRRVEASLDGITFAPIPLTRRVRTSDGRMVVREVPVSEYRALRWPLGTLPKSQVRTVIARVRIQSPEVAALMR